MDGYQFFFFCLPRSFAFGRILSFSVFVIKSVSFKMFSHGKARLKRQNPEGNLRKNLVSFLKSQNLASFIFLLRQNVNKHGG